MPIVAPDGQTYYRPQEVMRLCGISRSTLFRILRRGPLLGVDYRDYRNWRLFSTDQLEAIRVGSMRPASTSRCTKPTGRRQ